MRIQHNITALNAHRNLSNNNSAVGKNLEKLSSGYRINRAGDDAAGLAISEKMRAQITGLQTAQKNAEDGVSLVQTAEGALTEVHSMLNRMVELATQSANGTYSENNRAEMQKEIDALTNEIDRISNTSNFNGTKLFGGGAVKTFTATGTAGGTAITGTKQAAAQATFTTDNFTLNTGNDGAKELTIEVTDGGVKHPIKISISEEASKDMDKFVEAINADDTLAVYGITVAKDNTGKKLVFTSADAGSEAASVTKVEYKGTDAAHGGSFAGAGTAAAGKDAGEVYDFKANTINNDKITVNGKEYTATNYDDLKQKLDADGIEMVDQKGDKSEVLFREKKDAAGDAKTTISLHVGESSSKDNTIDVNIKAMSSKTLGISGLKITDVAGAKTAIDTINKAIDDVSSIRSDLGALQNRLEHTINNLGVQTENITAAESRIRDVDMAKEMMAYTKNNILVQASQAMLAQANQVPQGVLQLLQ